MSKLTDAVRKSDTKILGVALVVTAGVLGYQVLKSSRKILDQEERLNSIDRIMEAHINLSTEQNGLLVDLTHHIIKGIKNA